MDEHKTLPSRRLTFCKSQRTLSLGLKKRCAVLKTKHLSNPEIEKEKDECSKLFTPTQEKNFSDSNAFENEDIFEASQDTLIPGNQLNVKSYCDNIPLSLIVDLPSCFDETQKSDVFESSQNPQERTPAIDKSIVFQPKRLSQSTPITKFDCSFVSATKILKVNETLKKKDDKLAKSAPQKETMNDELSNCNLNASHFQENSTYNQCFNASFSNLKEMHGRNTINITLNENYEVDDFTKFCKSSQFEREVMGTFDNCENTLLNGGNDTMTGKIDLSVPLDLNKPNDISESFMSEVPDDLTQLMTKQSNSKKETQQKNNLPLSSENRKPFNAKMFNTEFYGLPTLAKMLIKEYKGIDKLYDWQNECLTLPAIQKRQNLIYALPTSGGKTLVAEILMLREVICRKKNVLFILPFVSIVQEKVWGLSPFAVSLGFLVEEYAAGKGTFPPRKRRNRKSIYIATLEKGLGLVRSLSENKRLGELGLVVVDELHLIGEPTRGCTLEMLLTIINISGEDIQIVGMSATIGNIDELAQFLNSHIFTGDFRPVELKEYIKIGDDIWNIDWNAKDEKLIFDRKINYGYSSQVEKIDPDHLGGLVMEVIPKGSCLIFCPTKKNCENVAVVLCKVIFKDLLEYRAAEKKALSDALRAEGCNEESLLSLIPWGVAYHHSGLATEERRLIEDAFRSGVLNILCCTSTLAAGVNLPAQRVILRAPMIGKNFLSLSTYKQMVGRAGRAGYGGQGDSILICQPYQVDKVRQLMSSSMEKACSSLHANGGANMRNFVLSALAIGTACSRKSLRTLLSKTLLSVQAERLNINTKELLDKTIVELFKLGAINVKKDPQVNGESSKCDGNNSLNVTDNAIPKSRDSNGPKEMNKIYVNVPNNAELIISKLGKASVKGGLELKRAHELYADLKEAQKCFVLIGFLHLLFIVTPYDIAENIKPNLKIYYLIYSKMGAEALQTSKILGFTEPMVIEMAKGKTPKSIPEPVLNRFYVTLMLNDLWNQEPLSYVAEKYQVNRGMIQSLMLSASTFASSVLRFCEELDEFWAFRDLLINFSQRLSHCCVLELIPLMELPSVKKTRAMQLYKAGYKNIQSIAQANPADLMESVEHITRNVANQLISSAKLLLLEKVENLREEAEDVMEGLGVKK